MQCLDCPALCPNMIRGETGPSRKGKYSVVTPVMLRHDIVEYLCMFRTLWLPL
jgi:hypothetical protein